MQRSVHNKSLFGPRAENLSHVSSQNLISVGNPTSDCGCHSTLAIDVVALSQSNNQTRRDVSAGLTLPAGRSEDDFRAVIGKQRVPSTIVRLQIIFIRHVLTAKLAASERTAPHDKNTACVIPILTDPVKSAIPKASIRPNLVQMSGLGRQQGGQGCAGQGG